MVGGLRVEVAEVPRLAAQKPCVLLVPGNPSPRSHAECRLLTAQHREANFSGTPGPGAGSVPSSQRSCPLGPVRGMQRGGPGWAGHQAAGDWWPRAQIIRNPLPPPRAAGATCPDVTSSQGGCQSSAVRSALLSAFWRQSRAREEQGCQDGRAAGDKTDPARIRASWCKPLVSHGWGLWGWSATSGDAIFKEAAIRCSL